MSPLEVLVVDDEDGVRSSAADILRSEGYEVIEAKDGLVASQLLDEHRVSVLVLDVRMPRRDGISMIEMLDAPPPVVLMSAYSLDSDEQRRVRNKIHSFLKKPFPPLRLLEEVESAAERGEDA